MWTLGLFKHCLKYRGQWKKLWSHDSISLHKQLEVSLTWFIEKSLNRSQHCKWLYTISYFLLVDTVSNFTLHMHSTCDRNWKNITTAPSKLVEIAMCKFYRSHAVLVVFENSWTSLSSELPCLKLGINTSK